MPPKKDKSRQPTVEPESNGEENHEASGDQSGELVLSTMENQSYTSQALPIIPGFSREQVNDFMTMMSIVMDAKTDAKLEQRLGNFNTNRPQNSPIPDPQPHYEQQALSNLPDTSQHTNTVKLRAEEVGYFDPEYQQEQGSSGPVVNAGKHVFYKDVYVFTDRLKDLAAQRGESDIKSVMTACFRGSVLIWYSMELTDLERTLLRDANLDLWYTTLIDRFKTRTAVALSQLVGQTYSLADMQHTSPRAFIQHMLHLAKSANFNSTYNQLTLLWNQFAVNLRRDLPEPQQSTTIGQFLDQVDSKTSIWLELAQRQSQQQRRWRTEPTPQSSALDRQTNGQKNSAPQQHSGNNRLQPRLPISDKGHAYLADVTPDGYGLYEEEDEANQEH